MVSAFTINLLNLPEGATVPIVSFGHSLLHGAMHQAHIHGFIGIGMGF